MKKTKLYLLLFVVICIVTYLIIIKTSSFSSEKLPVTASEVATDDVLDLTTLDTSKLLSVASIGNSELKIDPQTTNVILYKDGKQVLETIPQKYQNESNPIFKSPLVVNYKLTSTSADSTLYAFDDSIEKGNYQLSQLDNGIRVTYSIGEEIIPIDQLPQAVEKKRFEKILDQADEEQQTTLNSYYNYSKEKDAYIRPPDIKPSKVKVLYDIFYNVGGYTQDDLDEDNKILDSNNSKEAAPINFTIPVDYLLTDNGDLEVNIDIDQITVSGVAQLTDIYVMPAMLAQKTGEFLVPDGSGAIINTASKKEMSRYSKEFSPITEDVLNDYDDIVSEQLLLPVFANDNTLAIIDSGSAVASLNVDLSAKAKLLYPSINYQYEKYYQLNTSGNGINLASAPANGTMSIIYKTSPEKQSYYDYAQQVAKYYQQKYDLQETGDYVLNTDLDILGSYNMTNYLLGIPYDDIAKLTSYQDIQTMLDELGEKSTYNISLYGWSSQGLKANLLNTKLNKVCGKNENQLDISYAINLLTLDEENMGKFNPHTDVINGLEGKANKMYPILNSSFKENEMAAGYYYISPEKINSVTDKFIKTFDISDSITINDAGHIGYADYQQNHEFTPIIAENSLMMALQKLNENYNLTINQPILERGFMSDRIIGLPTSSSNNDLFDYDVPFVQLVYSNLLPTANTSINLSKSGDVKTSVMKAMEVKNDLSFTLAFDDTKNLKDSEFDQYYAVQFDYWKEIIKQAQDEYNQFLQSIDNAKIANHQTIDNNISKVTYDNGDIAYFNYNPYDITIDGITVKAESYLVNGGE